MSSLWEQRAARNEALFREVNQNIDRLQEQHGDPTTVAVFVCECAGEACTERLTVDPETFHRVREHARRFLVLPGHEDPQLERVVETHSDYLIVEKTGPAGQVAEQTAH